jgi:uncharacterized protein (TIGR02147 family)
MRISDTHDNNQDLDGSRFLQHELTRRISANPRYSLRAFAKALRISPAMLSLVLARKQSLSQKSVDKISKVVPMSPGQLGHLYKMAQLKKHKGFKSFNLKDHENVKQMTMEIFTVLSQWYHFAILSLLELGNSNIQPRWISKKLGISLTEAKLAINRLVSLGLITQTKGRWKQTSAPMRIGTELSTTAARQFQKQLLEKALFSLENDDLASRDITSMTFSMDPSHLNYASERITEFRRALTADLEKKGKPKAVYSLTIQLFPLTKESSP